MSVLLSILIVIASIVLILFVLVQNSKGGGLASSFASSNQIMGVKKTTDFVEKVTWGLVAAIVVLSIAATAVSKSSGPARASEISDQLPAVAAPQQTVNFDDAVVPAADEAAAPASEQAETPAE